MNPPTNKLFSDYYQGQGSKLHADKVNYGRGPRLRLHRIVQFVHDEQVRELLDYGCGKAILGTLLRCHVHNYDPMITKHSADPVSRDYLVAVDVLEHIEPEYLDNVLRHISTKFKKKAIFYISWAVGTAYLPDGRDAHLILEDELWWFAKLREVFNVEQFEMKPYYLSNTGDADDHPTGAYFIVTNK